MEGSGTNLPVCPKCGAVERAGASYCSTCGVGVVTPPPAESAHNLSSNPCIRNSHHGLTATWMKFKAMSDGARVATIALVICALLVLWVVCDNAVERLTASRLLREAQRAVTSETVARQAFTTSDQVLQWSQKKQLTFDRAKDDSAWTATKFTQQDAVDDLHEQFSVLHAAEDQKEQQRLSNSAELLLRKQPKASEARKQITALTDHLYKIKDTQLASRVKNRIKELEKIAAPYEEAERKRTEAERERIAKAAKTAAQKAAMPELREKLLSLMEETIFNQWNNSYPYDCTYERKESLWLDTKYQKAEIRIYYRTVNAFGTTEHRVYRHIIALPEDGSMKSISDSDEVVSYSK